MTKLITKRHARHTKKINISFRPPKMSFPRFFSTEEGRKENRYQRVNIIYPYLMFHKKNMRISIWKLRRGIRLAIKSRFCHSTSPTNRKVERYTRKKELTWTQHPLSLCVCLSVVWGSVFFIILLYRPTVYVLPPPLWVATFASDKAMRRPFCTLLSPSDSVFPLLVFLMSPPQPRPGAPTTNCTTTSHSKVHVQW